MLTHLVLVKALTFAIAYGGTVGSRGIRRQGDTQNNTSDGENTTEREACCSGA